MATINDPLHLEAILANTVGDSKMSSPDDHSYDYLPAHDIVKSKCDPIVQDLVLDRIDQHDNLLTLLPSQQSRPSAMTSTHFASTDGHAIASTSSLSPPVVVVVGAGVIGLTTAVVLRELGYAVHVVARDLPSASTSPSTWSAAPSTSAWAPTSSQDWASPWAGANWCSYASVEQPREHKWEVAAWYRYMALRETRPDLVEQYPFELFSDKPIIKERVWYADLTPDFRLLEPTTDEKGRAQYCMTYLSLGLHVPHYLQYLRECAAAHELPEPKCVTHSAYPVYTTRSSPHSSQAARPGPPVQFHASSQLPSLASALDAVSVSASEVVALVNATALGSAFLSDVQDKTMIPARGQTVLVRAPDVRMCSIHPGSLNAHGGTKGGEPSYIIPRALTGDVILGGTFDQGWWEGDQLRPSNATTTRILEECLKMNPALATRPPQPQPADVALEDIERLDPHLHATTEGTRLGIEVLSVNIGLRPNRQEGARLERDTLFLGGSGGGSLPLVHAYGCGPAGFQQSWGISEEVAELIDQVRVEAQKAESKNATLVHESTFSSPPQDLKAAAAAAPAAPAATPVAAPLTAPNQACALQSNQGRSRASIRNRPRSAGTEAAG